MLNIDGKRYPFEKEITIPPGKHTIAVPIINHSGLPCLLIEGKSIFTDESWEVINRGSESGSAGSSELYTTPKDNPQIFKFKYVKLNPFTVESTGGGVLYDFGRETFAKLVFEKIKHELTVYCGESLEEVLDSENCYLYDTLHRTGDKIELSARAFRYVFINAEPGEFNLTAYFEYLPVENKATFRCSDELINKIWDTSIYTFKLNSREFYLDGIKRDRWVWSGDAFQSYLIDRYCFFDTDIIRRTIIALRGNESVQNHINTILDYSFYWIISTDIYYEMTGNADFVKKMLPRISDVMNFCDSRLDENGFEVGMDDDWVFIDWADIEKRGAVCLTRAQLPFGRNIILSFQG